MLKSGSKAYNKPKLTVDELSAALYQANEELRKKNEELIAMQKVQAEMFANISHDLRSPITAIRSTIEYITSLDRIEENELKSTFELLTTRILRLEDLINDIFLLTKLDNSTAAVKFEDVNIGTILEEYYFNCEADSKYRKRQLLLKVPTMFDHIILADVKELVRVLDNLFENAYKYSKEGDTIELGANELGDDIVVWVKDTGIGIKEEYLNKVFDRTFTVSSARTPDAATGAGLGLAIAKVMVERHGGTIWCESKEGVGSCFFIKLPKKK